MTIKKIKTGSQCVYKYHTKSFGEKYLVELMINKRHFSKYRINTLIEAISWRDEMRSNSKWLRNIPPHSYTDTDLYTLKDIHQYINDCLMIEIKDLTRKRNVADGRFLFFAIARKCTKLSLEKIGAYLEKDHTTALHGIKMFHTVLIKEEIYNKLYNKYIDVNWIDPDIKLKKLNKKLNKRCYLLKKENSQLKTDLAKKLNFLKGFYRLSEEEQKLLEIRIESIVKMMPSNQVKQNQTTTIYNCAS